MTDSDLEPAPEKERIQKVLAASGLYSRRQVEKLIDEGKIKVNGVVLRRKGLAVNPLTDRIQVEGKAFRYEPVEETVAILVNKPRRVVVTRSDPEGRKTVYDLLPAKYATFKPIGRLDYNSQGALILTNDGDLILKLTHPRYHFPKTYEVKVSSHPDEKQIARLERGVVIDGVRTLPAKIQVSETRESSALLRITLTEGKNRQIRNMCDAVGLTVKELRRISIGPVRLKGLRSGQFRELTRLELKALTERGGRPHAP